MEKSSIFYQVGDQSFTYQDLLDKVDVRSWIDTSYVAQDYIDFITNVITAIIHNEDITLVDYRNKFGVVQSNQITIDQNKLDSVENLVEAIKVSKSQIGIYSSGSTGVAKLIYQPVSRLLNSVREDEAYRGSRWGFTYNPSHSAGIQVFLQVICNRATLYDLYKCNRSQILDTITNHQITHLSATPTFYRMLAPYDFEWPSIRSLTFNGEKSTLELINQMKRTCTNARIRNIYGSTESGPLMSSETAIFKVPKRLAGKMKVEHDELLIKSEIVSKSVSEMDWYHTGDLVRVVSDDPLSIEFLTRKSNVLNVGGQNVNPQEVEEALISNPNVKDCRVYGRKNKLIGNLIVAEVQLLDTAHYNEKELINWCKAHLADYKVPRMIKLIDRIEVGRTGKKL